MTTFLKIACSSALSVVTAGVQAGANDNPFLTSGKIEQLEVRSSEGPDPLILEGQFWAGYDLNKLLLKADVENVDGEYEEFELQALYSRAVSPYWNLQVGARKDFEPEPEREWGVIALQGLAPYFFEIDASLFVGGAGRTALRLSAEYELMLTQRLVLSPELEINAYGHNDEKTGIGSGLADAHVGLRLRYEIRREIAPYIGLNWHKKYGNTADFASTEGEAIEDTQLVIGMRAWY